MWRAGGIGSGSRAVLDGIDGFAHMLFVAFGFVMRLAPLGASGAMAFTVGRYGIKSSGSLGMLIGTFYVACIFFVVVACVVVSSCRSGRRRAIARCCSANSRWGIAATEESLEDEATLVTPIGVAAEASVARLH